MVKIIHMKEDPFSNGLRYGKEMKEQIDDIFRLNIDSVLNLIAKRGNQAQTLEKIEQYLKSCLPITKEYLPDLIEETRGIAEGAGKKVEDILSLNAFLDMFDFTFPEIKDQLYAGGCTCFGVRDVKTDAGYIAQNYDVRHLFAPGLILLDIQPEKGPRALVVTIAGMVGCVGLNEAGLGLVINNLTPLDSRPGIPHNYVVRHILTQEKIGDAINAVASIPRASGYNYILGDKNGEIVGLETTATCYNVYLPEKGMYVCHSNHYATEPMLKWEGSPAFNGDSIVRYSRARNLLNRLASQETSVLDGLKDIMQDHVNFPHSICRHIVPEGGDKLEFQGETVFSVVLDLKAQAMHLCRGNPCTGSYKKYMVGGKTDESA